MKFGSRFPNVFSQFLGKKMPQLLYRPSYVFNEFVTLGKPQYSGPSNSLGLLDINHVHLMLGIFYFGQHLGSGDDMIFQKIHLGHNFFALIF